MRFFIFLMMMVSLPISADASDQCAPDSIFSKVIEQTGISLSGPLNIDKLEKLNMIVIRETGQALPFGYSNKEWLELKTAMQPGDQIYFLSHRDGRFYVEYHILVRDGCIIRWMRGAIT